jgi:hypothetical protein
MAHSALGFLFDERAQASSRSVLGAALSCAELDSPMVIVWSAPLRYSAGRNSEKLRDRAVVGARNCLA